MSNPFNSILTNGSKSVGSSSGQKTSLNIERFEKSYASIYDEYKAASTELRAISTDAKAELTKEVEATEKKLKSEMKKAALKSFLTSAATQLPNLATSITALLGTAKNTKAGDTSNLQQMETQLSTAKDQVNTYNLAIKAATSEKETAEKTIAEQTPISQQQQRLIDQYKNQEETLQASLTNETDSQLVAAKSEKKEAEQMDIMKTDPATGQLKESSTLKQQRDAKISAANQKIEERKQQLENEIAEAKRNKDAAIKAKESADNLIKEAEQKLTESKNTITSLTPRRDKLNNEIQQLTTEIARIKGTPQTEPETK